MSDKNSNGMSVKLRALIMLYAAGIVALGAYPLRRDFSQVIHALRREAGEIRNTHLSWLPKALVEDHPRREAKSIELAPVIPPKTENAKRPQSMDKITREDRKELGKLIDEIGK
ncbi:MAG TPA: hypothetical protein PLP17_12510 [Oligoflexia bacterium]|nr:hypothetical protein [Oligoflexia bacterium]